jgi:hypothetical protein
MIMRVFYCFVALSAFLVVQAFIRDNFPDAWPHWYGWFLWKWELMKTSDALIVFVTLLAAVVAMKQLEIATKPLLIYINAPFEDSAMGLKVEKGKSIWRCTLKNVGAGSAIIQRCTFKFSTKSGDKMQSFVGYKEIIDLMEAKGFKNQTDFALVHITKGAAIGSQAEHPLLEFGSEVAACLQTFDFDFEYKGLLGGKRERPANAIPKDGIPVPLDELTKTKNSRNPGGHRFPLAKILAELMQFLSDYSRH